MTELGIEPGDIVTTSYGTGPYIVTGVHGPYFHYEIWGEHVPVEAYWGLSLKGAPGGHYEGRKGFIINCVRPRESGWITLNDEVYVAKPLNIYHVLQPTQMALFQEAQP